MSNSVSWDYYFAVYMELICILGILLWIGQYLFPDKQIERTHSNQREYSHCCHHLFT